MPTSISSIISQVRQRLIEPTPRFWQDSELVDLAGAGIRDLWRDIADLKQEHFVTIDSDHISLAASSSILSGVPDDIHKIIMLEPRDLIETGSNHDLSFEPLDYNHPRFQAARSSTAVDPSANVIYYAIHRAGGPIGAPEVRVAPQVTSSVRLSLTYVPTLGTLSADSYNPIPGESDNAVIAWTVAYARAKERDDRAPDPSWLAIYSNEKVHLLQSLGLREYQDPTFSDAFFETYW